MTEFTHEFGKNLSSGNKRKLAFAMSLLVTPAVELLDEPLTGVDPCARRGMIKVIQQLRKQQSAVLLTTHSMMEAE